MSYSTSTYFSFDAADCAAGDPSDEAILAAAKRHLLATDWSLDALQPLKEGLDQDGSAGVDVVDLRSSEIIDLFRAVSAALPRLRVFVRGLGEEHLDIWAAEIVDGEIVEQHGPFDD